MKLRILLILTGLILIIFSNSIFDTLYTNIDSVDSTFEIIKNTSIMLIGLLISLIGLFLPHVKLKNE